MIRHKAIKTGIDEAAIRQSTVSRCLRLQKYRTDFFQQVSWGIFSSLYSLSQ